MNEGRISTRYARALLLWTRRGGGARATYEAARSLVGVLYPHEGEIALRLGDSVVPAERKLEFVRDLLGTYNEELLALATLMVRKERGAYFVRALRMYIRLYERLEQIVSVEVRSAQAIDEVRRERLEGYLRRAFGVRIEVHYVEDSDLIGGFQLLVDGRQYDRSVRGELRRMALALRG